MQSLLATLGILSFSQTYVRVEQHLPSKVRELLLSQRGVSVGNFSYSNIV